MKFFSYQTDFFIPILFISASAHLAVLGAAHLLPKPPQVFVLEAPSSIEISMIEEIVPKVIEEVIEENIFKEILKEVKPKIIEDIFIEVKEDVQEVIAQEIEVPVEYVVEQISEPIVTPEESLELTQPTEVKISIVSQESKGAQTEAKPLDYINLAPTYPKRARRRGWEGEVVLKVRVEKDGTAGYVEVHASSGYSLLDQSAVDAVKFWKFSPASIGSIHFVSEIIIPIKFQLKD